MLCEENALRSSVFIMNPISNDSDTNRLLQVVCWALTRHFGHEAEAAEMLVRCSHVRFAGQWNDDFYHHEGPFRSAALLHYSSTHGGTTNFNGFHEWYAAQELGEAHSDTMEHFRQSYFDS